MDFFIEKNVYNDLVNNKMTDVSNNNIIFNNGDDWKLCYPNIMTNEGFTFEDKTYISVSMFYLYDVNTNMPLILIVSHLESKVIANSYLTKLLAVLNQKCDYMPYAYFARSEHGKYLVNIANRLFSYQLSIDKDKIEKRPKENPSDIMRLFRNNKSLDQEIIKLSARVELTQKDGILFYLGSPYYVHQYLTVHDNDLFLKYTDNIKCDDFHIYTTKSFFRRHNDVCFPVKFKTEQEAQNFINSFYARKALRSLE